MKPEDFLIDGAAPSGNVPKPDLRDYLTARHVVSVMDSDFGTVGGGIADDTDGINNADVALAGYGVVWFPRVIGGYYVTESLVMNNNGTTWMGEGSGDYQAGGAVIIKTDVDDLDMVTITNKHCPHIKGIAFVNEAASPTGSAILVTNCQNGLLDDVAIRGFKVGVKFLPGATSPTSCFGWTISDSEIISCVDYAVDAQAKTNTLNIQHTTLSATNVALRFLDSVSLTIDGTSNIESAGLVGIDIDASTTTAVNAKIECHFEFVDPPTLGCIRLGATAKVWGVAVKNTHFRSDAGGLITVNCLNGSAFTNAGGNCSVGSFATGDPMLASLSAINDPTTSYAIAAMGNTNTTGTGVNYALAQKNAANAWKVFAALGMTASSVSGGNEAALMLLNALYGGAMVTMAQLFSDGGTPIVQSLGNLRLGNGRQWSSGSGSPEGAVTGNIGDLYTRTDGSTSTTLYVKTSGTASTTGWTAK